MPDNSVAKADEAEIRGLIKSWTEALHAKDVERVVSHYTPDLLAFDLAPPLAGRGIEPYRQGLQAWFPTWRGPIGLEITELAIRIGGDVAWSTSLNHLTGTRTNGEATDVWVRATVGFVKAGGRWRVAHEHVSVPFYMDGSYKAAVDLKP
jgi:PhnB protein